jgi:type VI secretion system protein VasJ
MTCPVVPDMIDMFTAAVNDKRYADILPPLEKAACKAPFWLDGQHLVVRCLEGMSATEAAQSVKHALAQLTKRFPEITTLKFKDGRPFATPKTVMWLESFAPAVFGENPFPVTGLASSPCPTQEEDEAKLLQDALAVNGNAGFAAGLESLGKVHPGRSRSFIRHSILRARYCVETGRTQSAMTLLRTIFDKLKGWELLDWEPEVTAEAVSLLMGLQTKQQKQDAELSAVLHMVSLETAIASSTKAKS